MTVLRRIVRSFVKMIIVRVSVVVMLKLFVLFCFFVCVGVLGIYRFIRRLCVWCVWCVCVCACMMRRLMTVYSRAVLCGTLRCSPDRCKCRLQPFL